MEKQFAYIIIADSDGLRDVPIGFVDATAKVIGIKAGPVPSIPSPPTPASTQVTLREGGGNLSAQQVLPVLVLGACAVDAYRHGGALAVALCAVMAAIMIRVWRQAWEIARKRPSARPGASSPARSAQSSADGPAPAAGA